MYGNRDSIEDINKKQNFNKNDWKETLFNLKKVFKFLKGNRKGLIYLIIVSIICLPLSIFGPALYAKELLYLNGELWEQLIRIAIFIFIVYSVQSIIKCLANLAYKKFCLVVVKEIQQDVIKETLNLNCKTIDDNGTGVFIERLSKDTSTIVEIFKELTDSLIELLSNIGIVIVMISINWIVSIYIVIFLLKTLILERKRTKKYYENKAINKEIHEKNSGLLTEYIRGSKDIKLLNASKVFIKKFDQRIDEANTQDYDMNVKDRRFYMIESIIDNIFELLFVVSCIALIYNGRLDAANFLLLYMYKDRLYSLSWTMSRLLDSLKSFNLSSNRVFSIGDEEKFPKEHFGKTKKELFGDIEFKDVKFGYNDKEILHGISFKLEHGKTYSFVGKSGSGKSTIFNLITKMYDVDNDSIYLDNVDINELSRDSIRDSIAIITQSPYIFNFTIRENLLLVRDGITEEEMKEACKTACIHDFIMNLPDGYDSKVGEGGTMLSGGERQRLAIARALLKGSNIILFDEATSALDNVTQEHIQDAINNLKGDHTILIIAHRLSTVIDSDKIFMIDDGNMLCSGSHRYLLDNYDEYKNLYKKEMSKE